MQNNKSVFWFEKSVERKKVYQKQNTRFSAAGKFKCKFKILNCRYKKYFYEKKDYYSIHFLSHFDRFIINDTKYIFKFILQISKFYYQS